MNKARIRFDCRRGMAELENRLLPFYEQHYQHLTPILQQQFADLLKNYEDTQLWDWLITYQAEPPTDLTAIVNEIRQHVTV